MKFALYLIATVGNISEPETPQVFAWALAGNMTQAECVLKGEELAKTFAMMQNAHLECDVDHSPDAWK